MSASGITRSASQGARPSPSHHQRFTSPGGQQQPQQQPPVRAGSYSSSSTSVQQHYSTMRHLTGGSNNDGSSNNNSYAQQQQQFVSLEEFQQLKRALERERNQREEAVTRLREDIYELKDMRRREKLDVTVATAASQQQQTARFPTVALGGGGAGAGGGDNSILSRLHRLELYQLQMLPQQLEALEDRLKARMDEKVKATAEVTKAEFKRAGDKLDGLGKEHAAARTEAAGKLAALEGATAQMQTTLSRTASQLEVLQTHRVHDEDMRARIEHELQAHHNFVKEMEGELRRAQDATGGAVQRFDAALGEVRADVKALRGELQGGAAQTQAAVREQLQQQQRQMEQQQAAAQTQMAARLAAAIDEATMIREVERRIAKEREELREFLVSRMKPVEAEVKEQHGHTAQELAALQARVAAAEERAATAGAAERAAIVAKLEQQMQASEARVREDLEHVTQATHNSLKEVNIALEAQIVDRVAESRDEVEDGFAQQLQLINDRIDEVARHGAGSMQHQQQYVRSLATELEAAAATARVIIDGTETFVREMRPEHASSFASCLERIAACRSSAADGESSSSSDALKVLYQFERGLGSSLNALREEVAEVRMQIGLAGGGLIIAGPGPSPANGAGSPQSPAGRVHL